MSKNTFRRCSALVLALLIMICVWIVPVSAATLSPSSIYASGAFVMDATTGDELWSKNPDTALVPASTTKLMTVYLVFEAIANGQITKDTLVPISSEVSSFSMSAEWTNVPLYTTGKYTVDELLNAVILSSACAATQALGELVAGSEADFVALMNVTCDKMGIDCSFVDSYGGSPLNQVTPRGLAELSRRLIADYPDFLNYSKKVTYSFHGKTYGNTNSFVTGYYSCNGKVDGMKTGSTTAAGYCMVVTAYQADRRVIAVTLKDPSSAVRYMDCQKLLNHGLAVLSDRQKAGYLYAYPDELILTVNGNPIAMGTYEIDGEYYILPQDLGAALNYTSGCFDLTIDTQGNMDITTSTLYTPNGTELAKLDETAATAIPATRTLTVDGQASKVSGYLIDETFYIPLTDLAEKLSLSVNLSGNNAFVSLPDFTAPFVDVPQDKWYSKPIRYVYDRGIMHGTSDVTFHPDVELNRAMVVQILYNLQNNPVPNDDSTDIFTDVPSNAWYYDAVQWASGEGLVSGRGNGIFDPLAGITRQEMVTMLYRYEMYIGSDTSARDDLSGFTDGDTVSDFALDAMQWALAEGVIQGMGDDTLQPNGSALRAQVAQTMMNLGY